MFAVGPDFSMWAISLLFGAFCVWMACSITKTLGAAASQDLGDAGTPGGLLLHIGQWLTIATRSPAVAFFALAVCAGVLLPAYYSYLYRPDGPRGYNNDDVTAYGQLDSIESNVCFQTDRVTSTAAGYKITIPRQTKNIDFTIYPPNASASDARNANLFIELDGSGAWYSIDNAAAKPVAIDHNGVFRINDLIPVSKHGSDGHLPEQNAVGKQEATLSDALGVQR